MHSVWEYNLPEWQRLIADKNLTSEEIAARVNITARHIYNVLNGTTRTCRLKTVKKIQACLAGNGIADEETYTLFIRR